MTTPARVAPPSPTRLRQVLQPDERRTLNAAIRRIVHDASPTLTMRVEDTLAGLAPHKIDEVQRGLRLFGSAAAGFATLRVLKRFAAMSSVQQDRMLAAWCESRLPQARTLYQLLRRLALLVHYSDASTHAAIGYRGALHRRAPAVAWEGPAPARDDVEPGSEPVLRAPARMPGAEQGVLPGRVIGAAAFRDAGVVTADAIIIGSGVGGAVAAARLAEAGRTVVILEAGECLVGDALVEHEGEMCRRLYAEGALRATDDLAVSLLQGATVGGGSTVNWMIMLRTPPHVLEEWRRRFGLEGMDARAMADEFARIEQEVHARRVPDDAHSPNNRLLLTGAAALGWNAVSGMINARDCVRAGFCGQGCRYGAKQGMQQVYLPRALAKGATLHANATAQRIDVVTRASGPPDAMPTKRVTATIGAPGVAQPMRTLVLEAPVVIVAGGAVETPLLLQRSGMGGGGVGRYLRLHPTTAVVGVHDREVYGAAGIPLSTMCDEFAQRDAQGYGFWLECPPLHPALGAVALSGFGEAHARVMRRFPTLSSMIALTRDGSDLDTSSGSVTLDAKGRAHIRYALTRADAANVTTSIEAAARLQLAAGAREVHTLHSTPIIIRGEADLRRVRSAPIGANRLTLFSAHVNGTARIGTDPATSGVRPDGQRHGVRGVYVFDGSMLPTGVGVNPQETIMAMASVLSGRLLEAWP